MRVLVTGWASFESGVATVGDVQALETIAAALRAAGIDSDTAWSAGFRVDGLHLSEADPHNYSHMIFACGPCRGAPIEDLHRRFAHCRRIAVGVSVLNWADPAVTGFDTVLARDGAGAPPRADLAIAEASTPRSVVAVIFAPAQPEYGDRGQHDQVHAALSRWLGGTGCAPMPLDTRLAPNSAVHCSEPDQFDAVLGRADWALTTRLHGLVRGLRCGVPVLAVDPVDGGGKLTAQAEALGWPALVPAHQAGDPLTLEAWRLWCRCGMARQMARDCVESGDAAVAQTVAATVSAMHARLDGAPVPHGRVQSPVGTGVLP